MPRKPVTPERRARLVTALQRLWAKRVTHLLLEALRNRCTILEVGNRTIVIRDERMTTYGQRYRIRWLADLTSYHTPVS